MTPRRRRALIVLGFVALAAAAAWTARDWIAAQVYLRTMELDARVASLQVERVTDVLALEPGARVADIGAGTGLFSRPFAAAVGPTGVVYAVDVSERLLAHIADTARAERRENLVPILAAPDDPRLPEPVELVFFCDVLHHIADRPAYLRTLRRYLRPGGRIAVIDFRRPALHLGPTGYYTQAELDGWMREAGYEPAGEHDFLSDNFFVIYRCQDCPDST